MARFIPARAGNTIYSGYFLAPIMPIGSSPLARGTLAACISVRPDLAHRFIPARAGNTCSRTSAISSPSVHPRSRGEHTAGAALTVKTLGSSPLARGTRPGVSSDRQPHRFIPARAGNTTARTTAGPSPTVHPRSRGEHLMMRRDFDPSFGSSPLARGTPAERAELRDLPSPLARGTHLRLRTGPVYRFIPARAGNTGRASE